MTDRTPNLPALACEDCPAVIHRSRGTGLGGAVLVVAVEHEPTCPWMARVAPDGATMSGADGVLLHFRRDDTSNGPESVGRGA